MYGLRSVNLLSNEYMMRLCGYWQHTLECRLGVKVTTCKAKAKAKDLTFKAKAKDLILEDNKVGYQNEYKSATMSKFNC